MTSARRAGAQSAPWGKYPGTYLLFLQLGAAVALKVGRLGKLELAAGWYVYVGSALGGLAGRLRWHARRGKRPRWHIDTLRKVAELRAVAVCPGQQRLECAVAARLAALPGARVPAPRFGASDCRCPGHLVHFMHEPELGLDGGWIIARLGPGSSLLNSCPADRRLIRRVTAGRGWSRER